MVDNQSLDWNKKSLRTLRLKMGWSRSDLARRLEVSCKEIEFWEEGQSIEGRYKGLLEVLKSQAEDCCNEVRLTPAAEEQLDRSALEQIDFSRVKADLE